MTDRLVLIGPGNVFFKCSLCFLNAVTHTLTFAKAKNFLKNPESGGETSENRLSNHQKSLNLIAKKNMFIIYYVVGTEKLSQITCGIE